MSVASMPWCCKSVCVVPCVSFCTGHFVMVPLNMTYLHCLPHSLFEHLFNLYCNDSIYNNLYLLFGKTLPSHILRNLLKRANKESFDWDQLYYINLISMWRVLNKHNCLVIYLASTQCFWMAVCSHQYSLRPVRHIVPGNYLNIAYSFE